MVLIDMAVRKKDLHDGQGHVGVIRPRPRAIRQPSLGDPARRRHEELLAESIPDG